MICIRCGVDDIDPVNDAYPPMPQNASYITIHSTPSSELTNRPSGHLVAIICDGCLAEAVLMDSIFEVDNWISDGASVAKWAKRVEKLPPDEAG